MSSRLRAGIGLCVAVVAVGAGAQSAQPQVQACAEPVFTEPPTRGTAKELVPMEVTSVTPGTEYLLKVNGREVKQGVADTDKVSRRFRMPNLGDKARDARLVLVLAHDTCENSPWKLKQEMRYRPAEPTPQAQEPTPPPAAQQEPAPTPTPTPTPAPTVTPTPTPSPSPNLAKPTPAPAVKPSLPQQPTTVNPLEPPSDARAWITPLDPFSKGSEEAPQPPAATNPSDRATEDANSTAALVGLLGLFVVLFGLSAVAWTRFRRYDDEQLATLLNPDGKLPAMLDDQAVDLGDAGMAGATAKAKLMGGALGVGGARTVPSASTKPADMEAPAVPPPTEAPTVPSETEAPVVAAASAAPVVASPIKAPIIPPAKGTAPVEPSEVPAAPIPTIKAPIVPPPVAEPAHANGAHVSNGAHAQKDAEPAPADRTPAVDGAESSSYGGEVESELQRILSEAGIDAEVESILSGARAEAARQGVAMDSDLMLRALTDETKGSEKLTRREKDQLEYRFQRIAAEESRQPGPSGDQ